MLAGRGRECFAAKNDLPVCEDDIYVYVWVYVYRSYGVVDVFTGKLFLATLGSLLLLPGSINSIILLISQFYCHSLLPEKGKYIMSEVVLCFFFFNLIIVYLSLSYTSGLVHVNYLNNLPQVYELKSKFSLREVFVFSAQRYLKTNYF